MKTLLTLTLALIAIAVFSGLSAAQPKGVDKASPKPMTGELTGTVTGVEPGSKTFTVAFQGRAITFSAAKLGQPPKVGETVAITFTENPGGPPMATTATVADSTARTRVGGKAHCGNKDVPGGYHDPLYTLNVCQF